jgi:hypothetical protein
MDTQFSRPSFARPFAAYAIHTRTIATTSKIYFAVCQQNPCKLEKV